MKWRSRNRVRIFYGEVRAMRRFCWWPTRCEDGHTHWLELVWVIEAFAWARFPNFPDWERLGVECVSIAARGAFLVALGGEYCSGFGHMVAGRVSPDSLLNEKGELKYGGKHR